MWSSGQGSPDQIGFGESQGQETTGAECEEWLPHPQPSWISCTTEVFFLLAQGRLETAPQKLPQRMSILLILIYNPSVAKGATPLQALSQGYLAWKQGYQLSNTATLLNTRAQSCKVPELEETVEAIHPSSPHGCEIPPQYQAKGPLLFVF